MITAPLSQRAPTVSPIRVERRELALRQRRRAFQHRIDHIAVGPALELADPHHGVEDKPLVANWGSEAHVAVPC